MISIRNTLNELERVDELKQLACIGYANAIRSAADYAVELDAAQAAEFRRNLRKICEQLESAAMPEDFQAVQANLRGELGLYRDLSGEWLERFQRDLNAAATAMETLAGGFLVNGVDHEKRLKTNLGLLTSVADSQDLNHVKTVVKGAAANIVEDWEQLRCANQLVIAQLNDEIRSLHREIDNERHALLTDTASGAWNRDKIRLRIDDNLTRTDGFSVILIRITNLKWLTATYPYTLTDAALKAMVKRIHGIVGKDAMIARWSEDEFAVLLELDPTRAISVSSEICKALSARYAIDEDGATRNLTLRVNTAVVERPTGSEPRRFREKLTLADTPRV